MFSTIHHWEGVCQNVLTSTIDVIRHYTVNLCFVRRGDWTFLGIYVLLDVQMVLEIVVELRQGYELTHITDGDISRTGSVDGDKLGSFTGRRCDVPPTTIRPEIGSSTIALEKTGKIFRHVRQVHITPTQQRLALNWVHGHLRTRLLMFTNTQTGVVGLLPSPIPDRSRPPLTT